MHVDTQVLRSPPKCILPPVWSILYRFSVHLALRFEDQECNHLLTVLGHQGMCFYSVVAIVGDVVSRYTHCFERWPGKASSMYDSRGPWTFKLLRCD